MHIKRFLVVLLTTIILQTAQAQHFFDELIYQPHQSTFTLQISALTSWLIL